jgi:hypothetical protein
MHDPFMSAQQEKEIKRKQYIIELENQVRDKFLIFQIAERNKIREAEEEKVKAKSRFIEKVDENVFPWDKKSKSTVNSETPVSILSNETKASTHSTIVPE